MRKFFSVALCALLLSLAGIVARASTPSAPPAAIMALAQAVIDSTNANQCSKLAGVYTNDGIVIDEDAPFTWTGADAGVAWCENVQKAVAARHGTKLQAVGLAITEFRMDPESDDAYLIQPLTISVTNGAGQTHVEEGAQTYTFHKENGAWKISSATWTTMSSRA